MTQRTIIKTVTGSPTIDGAGVKLVRVLGTGTVYDFDPFLMLDAFDSTNPDDYVRGFPMHPHRGIETFTYLIEGEIDHQDSLGNSGVIRGGDCQWMTAGRGILHQEMPKAPKDGRGRMLGLQLWINLPAKHKMTEPKYRDITAASVPVVQETAAAVRVVSGEYKGQSGAARGEYVDALFLDVTLAPNGLWALDTPPGVTVFAYILQGSCSFPPHSGTAGARRAVLFSSGDILNVSAKAEGARLIVVSGPPLREPVAWGGPIVMNTKEELTQARRDLADGTFVR